jgi:dihydropteroate synthase
MIVTKLSGQSDKKALLKKIGSTLEGERIMIDKMQMHYFYIKDLRTPAANILKQDALSIGAELAVEKDTILCKDKHVDALLIANDKQLKILSKKELMQPFGLKELALSLKEHLLVKEFSPRIMGILNANEDSFYHDSHTSNYTISHMIEKMIEDGADIIDIGAVSSRPGAKQVSEEDEFRRLKLIIDNIYLADYAKEVSFSLDSYATKPLCYALDKGFSIINDITGLESNKVCELAASYKATVVLMHMQGTPQTMQVNPHYNHLIDEVDSFFKERLAKAERFGIKEVILDVGLGFGKTLEHNLLLLKHLGHFRHFGREILIGASRKSMIDMIEPTPVKERLPATLALHLKAVDEGASILRVHDVKAHQQALSIYHALNGVSV